MKDKHETEMSRDQKPNYLTASEDLEETVDDNLEDVEPQDLEEDQLYFVIDKKLDKMYRAAKKGAVEEVNLYQEELSEIYDNLETLELNKII